MKAEALVRDMSRRGVRLSRSGTDLVVDAPRGALAPEEIEELRNRKPELLAVLPEPEARRVGASADSELAAALAPHIARPEGVSADAIFKAFSISGRAIQLLDEHVGELVWLVADAEAAEAVSRSGEPFYLIDELEALAVYAQRGRRAHFHALRKRTGGGRAANGSGGGVTHYA